MITKKVKEEIDRAIKQIWVEDIVDDYANSALLLEDSLKCSFYYHLRRRLGSLLVENNLKIYPEYYFSNLGYKADIAIVEIDPEKNDYIRNRVTSVVAILELKYKSGYSKNKEEEIKRDIQKLRQYHYTECPKCLCYLAVIYEESCYVTNWMDKRSTGKNKWANGCATELTAAFINGYMQFEVRSYNGLNQDCDTVVVLDGK